MGTNKLINLSLHSIKTNKVIAIIYSAILFLGLPFMAFMMNNKNNFTRSDIFEAQGYVISSIALIIFAIILACVFFKYRFSQKSQDFYSPLPISNNKSFFARYFSGLATLIIPAIIMILIYYVIFYCSYSPVEGTRFLIFLGYLKSFLLAIYAYTLMVLFIQLSQNILASFVYFISFNAAIILLILIINDVITQNYVGYAYINVLDNNILLHFSVFYSVIFNIRPKFGAGIGYADNFKEVGIPIIIYLISIAVLIAVILYVIKYCKKDNVKNKISFFMTGVFNVLISVCGGYTLYKMFNRSAIFDAQLIIYTIIISAILFFIIHLISNKGLTKILKSYIIYGSGAVALILTILIIGLDPFGVQYKTFDYKEESVATVRTTMQTNNNFRGESTFSFTSEEDFNTVKQLQKMAIENSSKINDYDNKYQGSIYTVSFDYNGETRNYKFKTINKEIVDKLKDLRVERSGITGARASQSRYMAASKIIDVKTNMGWSIENSTYNDYRYKGELQKAYKSDAEKDILDLNDKIVYHIMEKNGVTLPVKESYKNTIAQIKMLEKNPELFSTNTKKVAAYKRAIIIEKDIFWDDFSQNVTITDKFIQRYYMDSYDGNSVYYPNNIKTLFDINGSETTSSNVMLKTLQEAKDYYPNRNGKIVIFETYDNQYSSPFFLPN